MNLEFLCEGLGLGVPATSGACAGLTPSHMHARLSPFATALFVIALFLSPSAAKAQGGPKGKGKGGRPPDNSAQLLAEPFRGITTDGTVKEGLFKIEATGVSTEPVRMAAVAFLDGLSEPQRAKTVFPVDDPEWRQWDNRHFAKRQGVGFDEMTEAQRELAFELFKATLSAKGVKTTRDVMRLNETLAELTGRHEEYGEWLYWITIMGTPSATEPWGWQLDGHHVIINCFILGDQMVMTPLFMGSEPIRAESGKHQGVMILQTEQDKGLAFMQSLDATQQAKALIQADKTANHNETEAYKDNAVLAPTGLLGADLTAAQKTGLLDLIGEFVSNMREGHAKVKMSEVEQHLDETYFAWVGVTVPDAVFYFRIHSPVVLIEFDHQRPVALDRTQGPTRNHIHSVVRTPNGNDYGKDLLRQHLEHHHSK